MSSIEQALITDFWRRGKWGLLMTLPTLTLLPLIVYGILFWGIGRDEITQAIDPSMLIGMQVVLMLMTGFCAATCILGVQGSLKRSFTLPISTTRLVICQLTQSAAAGALAYLMVAGLLNLFVGANWPLWGPALFFAAVLASTQAALWLTEGSLAAQFVALCGTGVPLGIWLARRYGATVFGDWKFLWSSPTAPEVLTLLAVTVAAYALAIAGVARNRRGDAIDFAGVIDWFFERFTALRRVGKFHSPQAAQFWFERQQKLVAMPAVIICLFMLLSILPGLAGLATPREMLERVFGAGIATLVGIAMVYGLILGNYGSSSHMFHMQHYLGSRPLSDAALAWSMLKTGGVALAAACGVWLMGLGLSLALILKLEGSLATIEWHYGTFLLVVLPACWAAVGTAASLSATGWPRWLATLVLGGLLAVAAYFVAGRYIDPTLRYYEAGFATIGLVLLGITGWTIARTRISQIVPERTTWLVALAWFVVVSATIVLSILLVKEPLPPGLWIYVAGLSSLVVLPFVAAPLAVSWNRHG